MSGTVGPRGPRAAVVAGALLALGAPAGWAVLSGPAPASFGAAAASGLAAAGPAAPGPGAGPVADGPAAPGPGLGPVAPEPGPVAAPGPPDPGPEAATGSARLVDVLPRADPPVEVLVAGRAVPVDPVGVDDDAQVVVPDDVQRAGWWTGGVQPGEPAGAAVLVGHVDDDEQGLGAFAVLRELDAGAEVRVRTSSGTELVYDVVAREQFDKAEVPVERVFSPAGAHRLVLVSCGGTFHRGRYSDNVVVTAVPRR